jgi:serine phosphatase RsbU (regulator of sigma subunit)/AmiR/NasT family two-component response regulator
MGKPRIMVVEDEKLVALAIEKSLLNMGYQVPATVSSGEEAVQKAMELNPDLILMDIRLRGIIDGVEAANRIRSASSIPIVYLSAYSEEKTLQRAKVTEPFGYITKPFEERTLQTTVEIALYKAVIDVELARTKKQLETVLRCIGEGVVVMSAEGGTEYVVKYMNPAARALLPGVEEKAEGMELSAIFRVFDAASLEKTSLPLDAVAKSGKSEEVSELVLVTRDKARILIDCSLAPYREEGGAGRGIVLSFRDVTERRKMQELITLELRQALEIQKSLLPRANRRIPGLKLAWLFHPASLAAGDLFMTFPIDDGHAGMFIIDVAGHGIASAVNSLLLHRFLTPDPDRPGKLQLLDADPLQPKEVVDKLAARFSLGSSLPFFSLLYGTIDTEEGTVRMVRAGIPYPIWQKRDGTLSLLRVQGGALGVTPELAFTEHEVRLDPGDRLFLYSDGLVECRNPDMTPYSEDRLVAMIRQTRSAPLADAVTAMDSQIVQWRASRDFDDDICLQAIERE